MLTLQLTGAENWSTIVEIEDTTWSTELLVAVDRDGPQTLGAQIEVQLRRAIRDGSLRPGAGLPSTRDLARQIGVSRRIVVDAYAQLAAEGYLSLRQGARPRVSAAAVRTREPKAPVSRRAPHARFDFRPSHPDVSAFPRTAWLRSLREALATMTNAELGYGDPRGAEALRGALAEYLGRVRGVVANPEHIVVTNGYTQGLGLVCHALADAGAKRIALEEPSNPQDRLIVARAGLAPITVEVDDAGTLVGDLDHLHADAVVLTPAHQHPTGAVLGGGRRADLLAWLRERHAIAIEDDYDAEYRFDRAAIGALQGLDPSRVVYAGSVSKTLAPALRIGWLVVPPSLIEAVTREKLLADRGTSRIEQHALADFVTRGELDRHLRRMRTHYRIRRDTLVAAITEMLPEASIRGVPAGLHVTVQLPDSDDEQMIHEEANRGCIELETMNDYQLGAHSHPPTLLLGYGQMPEQAINGGVRELVAAIRAARARAGRKVTEAGRGVAGTAAREGCE
jgi:GntR family transcriptional regulator/MocR family aminotransferase